MKVYTIERGCVYEGGGLESVHIFRDEAMARFNEMVEKKRESNRAMEEFESEQEQKDGERYSEVGYWLKEDVTTKDDGTVDIVFYDTDYITLKVWSFVE